MTTKFHLLKHPAWVLQNCQLILLWRPPWVLQICQLILSAWVLGIRQLSLYDNQQLSVHM